MINPDVGVIFTESSDGNLAHEADRRSVSSELGIPATWAFGRQVHGSDVHWAETPGSVGEGDAIVTDAVDLPIAVFTADCVGVVIKGERYIAVAHAGWRGLVAGVLEQVKTLLDDRGDPPRRAWLGPSIGPCCYQVGEEVVRQFPESCRTTTTEGKPSVDLWKAAGEQLDLEDQWVAGRCTYHDLGLWSHRGQRTRARLATLAWIGGGS